MARPKLPDTSTAILEALVAGIDASACAKAGRARSLRRPAATKAAIRKREATLELELPEEYRDFLLATNGLDAWGLHPSFVPVEKLSPVRAALAGDILDIYAEHADAEGRRALRDGLQLTENGESHVWLVPPRRKSGSWTVRVKATWLATDKCYESLASFLRQELANMTPPPAGLELSVVAVARGELGRASAEEAARTIREGRLEEGRAALLSLSEHGDPEAPAVLAGLHAIEGRWAEAIDVICDAYSHGTTAVSQSHGLIVREAARCLGAPVVAAALERAKAPMNVRLRAWISTPQRTYLPAADAPPRQIVGRIQDWLRDPAQSGWSLTEALCLILLGKHDLATAMVRAKLGAWRPSKWYELYPTELVTDAPFRELYPLGSRPREQLLREPRGAEASQSNPDVAKLKAAIRRALPAPGLRPR